MTAPARTQQQQTATPSVVDMSLVDRIIAESVATPVAHKRIAPFLVGTGQSYDRIAAQLREAILKVPLLAKCDPNTITDAVVTIQRWQLEIGETAHLVPFKDNANSRWVCTPVRGYIGDIELLIRNGIARRVDAFCVYKNEPFTYREGTNPLLEHMPLPPSQRGEMIGAYAILWQTFTNSKAAFLYVEDIEVIRQTYSKQWNKGDLLPWYAKKCAVKAVTKLLPKSPKLAKLREQMDEDEIVAQSVERGISTVRPAFVDDDGVDLRGAEDDGATDEQKSAPDPVASISAKCPTCSGDMWDNRAKKASGEWASNRPDFSCKDRGCKGAIWPPKNGARSHNTQGALPIDDARSDAGTNALAHP